MDSKAVCREVPQPIAAEIDDRYLFHFGADGRMIPHCDSEHDLINIPTKHTREFWVNLYPDSAVFHALKATADQCAFDRRLACKQITIEFEEGEGL